MARARFIIKIAPAAKALSKLDFKMVTYNGLDVRLLAYLFHFRWCGNGDKQKIVGMGGKSSSKDRYENEGVIAEVRRHNVGSCDHIILPLLKTF